MSTPSTTPTGNTTPHTFVQMDPVDNRASITVTSSPRSSLTPTPTSRGSLSSREVSQVASPAEEGSSENAECCYMRCFNGIAECYGRCPNPKSKIRKCGEGCGNLALVIKIKQFGKECIRCFNPWERGPLPLITLGIVGTVLYFALNPMIRALNNESSRVGGGN